LQRARASPSRATGRPLLLVITLGLALASASFVQFATPPSQPRSNPAPHLAQKLEAAPGRVWLVETNERFELYSNGLQVQDQFATSTQPRSYFAFSREGTDGRASKLRFDPVGIVFHTTESHMAPFEEDQNRTLRRAGEGVLEYVRRNHAYHFVIDRFGRVFRVVRESDYANHAGHSIWADQSWVYLNLNQSFFGVAFEARSRPDDKGPPVNAAQVHAGRILIEMLRSRYKIAAANCVTHAQVSVNPSNHRAGYHTDWAVDLPFHDLGLSDNYQHPLPSVMLFGFTADAFAGADGNALRPALHVAEDQLREEALARGIPLGRYREILQRKYRDALASTGRQN